MCGFAGVISWDRRYPVLPEALQRMLSVIIHRGPDGQGIYLNHTAEPTIATPQAGLVHCRLAILDPEERANQPFCDDRGNCLVFNGEIYNFRQLRAELTSLRPDYVWRTDSDTEVLLLAYVTWRERCLEKLNGMFAFAVWNEKEQSLFLARDRMGQKPLYYAAAPFVPEQGESSAHPPATIAFASELRALRTVSWFDPEVATESLLEYLRWGYTPPHLTIYRGVRKIMPHRWVRIAPGEWTVGSYFDPNLGAIEHVRAAAEQPVSATRRLVTEAVRRQLVSDVPLGCFLSGGIDSSVIAAAMKSVVGNEAVKTFAIGFDDPRYDETQHAAAVARHLKTEHRQFIVRPDAAADLPRLAQVFGEPFADSSALPTHYLARETRNYVKVALSGDGGDELFGGYERYRAMLISQALRFIPSSLRRAVASLIPGADPKSLTTRVKRLLAGGWHNMAERYAQIMALFPESLIRQLLPHDIVGQLHPGGTIAMVFDAQRLLHERDVVEAALAVDRVTYLPEDLLTKVDRASMLHALEVRSPFMDHELVNFAATLRTDHLLAGGPKKLLRHAFRADLPAFVFNRRKMGFAVPIGEWFRTSLHDMLRDALFATDSFAMNHFERNVLEKLIAEHQSQRADHSQRLYALLMLELWWQDQGG